MLTRKISIIVPTYDEVGNISRLLEAINKLTLNIEVAIVDDCSPDGTSDAVERLMKRYSNVKLLIRDKKMGLGSAYKAGLKLCTGNVVVEMDADLSHDPTELPRIVEVLGGADVVVGSRHVDGGKIVGWKWHRKLISKVANFLARVILGLKVNDSTSGFRAYKKKVFERIASVSTVDGFEFQVEAIHIARKLGFKVTEVPITFRNRKYGKSKLCLRDMVDFAKAILKMKFS